MKTIATVTLLTLVSIYWLNLGTDSVKTSPDRTHTPAVMDGTGPATSARLLKRANRKAESIVPSNPLKGPAWIEVDEAKDSHPSSNEIVLNSGDHKFSVKLTESPENEGDTAVYRVSLIWNSGNKTPVDLGVSTGAIISPDSKYVVVEPLRLVDIDAWEAYDLRKAFSLKEGYVGVDRWSKDGKKFIVHLTQCVYDCLVSDWIEFWLIELR